MHVFEHIKMLYEMKMFNDVKNLASIALNLCESQVDLLSSAAKYQTLIYYGDAVYKDKEYKRAEIIYKKAQQMKKWMKSKNKIQEKVCDVGAGDGEAMDTNISPKHTSPVSPTNQSGVAGSTAVKKCVKVTVRKTGREKKTDKVRRKKDDDTAQDEDHDDAKSEGQRGGQNVSMTDDDPHEVCSEVELKYKLYQCYVQTKQSPEAINVLEGINAKLRNAKINMALAKLYDKMGMDRSAVTAYKAVLRECPLSLEASQGLLSLGVKGREVDTLMNAGSVDWLSSWIKGEAHLAAKEYSSATHTYRQLDVRPLLRDNIEVLCKMAESQYLSGQYTQALDTLQRVHATEPLLLHKMDVLAFLLFKTNAVKELENLSCSLMAISEDKPEPWVAMGYYCLASKKTPKAVYFAQKAYSLDSWNVESLLLKGSALLEAKKTQDAVTHFREVLRLAPHRYEAHKGLIDCYTSSHRTREAVTLAGQAVKQLGQSARSLTLYASVLALEPLNLEKAKSYLEKAMKMDCSNLDPVYNMAEILNQQEKYDMGKDLLRKALHHQSTARLHQMLGDFLSHSKEHQEALDQYSIALSLDSGNQKALEGQDKIEKQGEPGMDTTYDGDADEMNDTDNEADLDGSDLESAAWSDIDLS